MKITAYNGSPAGLKGTTGIMLREILAGAEEAGAAVQNHCLALKDIRYCTGCVHCFETELNKCAIQDDMQELLQDYGNSDLVIFASPLYVDNISGIMKVFFDRCLSLGSPHVAKDENGETRHVDRAGFSNAYSKAPKWVAVSNAAFPEMSQFQVVSLLYRRMARNFHTEVAAEIYRGAGGLVKGFVPELQPVINDYLKILRQAGRELATGQKLTDATKTELASPLIPDEAYLYGWNQFIDLHWGL